MLQTFVMSKNYYINGLSPKGLELLFKFQWKLVVWWLFFMNLLTDLFGKIFFTNTSSRLLWYLHSEFRDIVNKTQLPFWGLTKHIKNIRYSEQKGFDWLVRYIEVWVYILTKLLQSWIKGFYFMMIEFACCIFLCEMECREFFSIPAFMHCQ